MRKLKPDIAFEDDRGTICDLLEEPVNAVTRIWTKKGAIRGNHLHRLTTQWAYVASGVLRVSTGQEETLVWPGEMVVNEPGEPHAWEALEDTECIVFARGPRAGKDYESDVYRLEMPLIDFKEA